MKILVVGSGGREHALAWKAAQSPDIEKVFVAPGNAGTKLEAKLENVAIDVLDFSALANLAIENQIELTIIGPEVPLVEGIVDYFHAKGLRCFGPTKAAAQLEGSKTFTKDFLARHNIPTAEYKSFTDSEQAIAYVKEKGTPIVIKADGLAAGKGVIIAESEAHAINTIKDMLAANTFGEAGHRVVIEEFLSGEEASFIVMVDGKNVLPLATSQDHKARDEGDKGPNTGGMGAYSPAPVITDSIFHQVMKNIIYPTVKGMAEEGNEYTGFLYAGLMVGEDGIAKVLEYNCRFGDPETQPIMMRLKSSLVELCSAAIDKKLAATTAQWDPRPAVGVVLAAGGYPGSYNKGDEIAGLTTDSISPLSATDDHKVFHAGTAMRESKIVTNGGRVLCVTALGETIAQAQSRAYEMTTSIHWDKMYYRKDIAYRAIDRDS